MLLRTLLWRATGALLLAVAFFACEGGPANPFSNPPIESGLPPTLAEPGLPVAFSHDSNPVREGDFADPFVLVTDSLYYAYATNVGTGNVREHWEIPALLHCSGPRSRSAMHRASRKSKSCGSIHRSTLGTISVSAWVGWVD